MASADRTERDLSAVKDSLNEDTKTPNEIAADLILIQQQLDARLRKLRAEI